MLIHDLRKILKSEDLRIFPWLGLRFRNITFMQEEDVDVKEIRDLLDEDSEL
jgi:hypothetical protein